MISGNFKPVLTKIAKEESRTRSELIREAARLYIERKSRWLDIFDYARKHMAEKNLDEKDVLSEIKKYRKENR